MKRRKPRSNEAIIIGCYILVLVLCVLASAVSAAPWTWSPAAQHHAAVVKIQTDSGDMYSLGSGCYVDLGDFRGVLTAKHVIDGRTATVIWSEGTTSTGDQAVDRFGHDLALIRVSHPRIRPLAIAARRPAAGEWVELCGFGACAERSRHWWGRVSAAPYVGITGYSAAVIQGDSGGPILVWTDSQPRVCGVISAGGMQFAAAGTAAAFRETVGPNWSATRAFADRVNTQWGVGIGVGGFRSGGGCPPGGGCPQPSAPRQLRPDELYPPAPSPIQRPPQLQPIQQPPAMIPVPSVPPVPPVAATPPAIDYDRLAAEVLARLPPVRVQIVDRDGTVLQDQAKRLGEPIRFQLVPMPR